MEDQAPYGKENALPDNKRITQQMTIIAYSNGDVNVKDFPLNAGEAIELLTLAIKAVTDFFINAAIDGKIKRNEGLIVPITNVNTLN